MNPRRAALFVGGATLLWPALAFSQSAPGPTTVAPELPVVGIVALVLLPLLLVAASAFVKVAVVLGLLRSAFGSQDVPPPLVVTALAVLLSLVVMSPVLEQTTALLDDTSVLPADFATARETLTQASGPLLAFLERNSSPRALERFAAVVGEVRGTPVAASGRIDVLLPAFVATELTEAFQLGFLLLLPFLVLDLVVAAVLQGAGLATVQPAVVSLPLKLVLFVLIDGWQLLLEALMLGYV